MMRFSLKLTLAIVLASVLANASSANLTFLTNMYSNELTELTADNANTFLLAPEHSSHQQQSSADESQTQTTSNQQTLTHSLQQHQQLQQSQEEPQLRSDTNNNQLTSLWRNARSPNSSLQQQQQQQQLTQSQRSSIASNTIDDSTTDFPNPNLNNLGSEITKILKKFFLHGYDKRVRPNYSGPPALVNLSFHIIGISSVDEVQMDFTTDFYFRQKWFDPRLEFEPVGKIDELCVGAEFAEKIWLPDTFFANEKTATFHKATTENTFIRIGSNGRVYRSIRLTVTCSCPMDLQYFPMDRQRCKIEIESYGYNTRDIDYRWERGDDSVSLNTKIELPQFKILGFRLGQEIQNLSSGDYIRLYCEIHFVRSMGYYLIQIYIPASLIVMISWVSFWLHRNATPARVALGVTTVLTMTTLMSSTNAALPKISYIKSIDVFLGTCFVMVFAALLEYASVGYIGKRIAMKRKRLQNLHEIQQHHQKICVAAAASAAAAAAAAAAAQEAAMDGNQHSGGGDLGLASDGDLLADSGFDLTRAQALDNAAHGKQFEQQNSSDKWRTQTMRSLSNSKSKARNDNRESQTGNNNNNSNGSRTLTGRNLAHRRSTVNVNINNNNEHNDYNQQGLAQNQRSALPLPGLSLANHGPPPEFDVTQTHDMIRIIGLTPSSIDKHSRVVFPICFVCFNLMYWIIYGHISQQTEDKGSPLIPFIRT